MELLVRNYWGSLKIINASGKVQYQKNNKEHIVMLQKGKYKIIIY